MEKFKKLLAEGLLLSFVIKMLIVSPSFSDMGIVLGLAAIVGLQHYLEKSTEIQDVKTIVSKQTEVIQTMAVEMAKLKTSIEGVRLKESFKGAESTRRAG